MRSSMVEILCFPEGSFKVVMKKKMAFTQKKHDRTCFDGRRGRNSCCASQMWSMKSYLLPRIQRGKHIMQEVDTMKTNGKVEWEDGEDKEMLTKKRSPAWLASSPDPNNTGVCLPENFRILQETISQVGHGMVLFWRRRQISSGVKASKCDEKKQNL